MHVEQMILTDLMEPVMVERQLWKQLDKEAQLKIIAILGDLISRSIRNKTTTSKEDKNERS
jgi:hypothetical protein